MDNGNDNILEMYLYETNTLLEQLDGILLNSEQANTFTQDDVNEIFRIMHTLKGSSAMMEFQALTTIAHRIEDLFFIIRENSMDAIPQDLHHELFDLMFHSTDFFRAEVEKIENNEPLSNDIDNFLADINSFIEKINGSASTSTASPAPAATPAPAHPQTDAAVTSTSSPAPASGYTLHVFFDEGCGMENLRAFMLVTALNEADIEPTYEPQNVDTDPDTAAIITTKGFLMHFDSKEALQHAIDIVKGSSNIQTYEVLDNPVPETASAPAASPAPATSSAPAAAPVASAPAPVATQQPAAPAPAPIQETKEQETHAEASASAHPAPASSGSNHAANRSAATNKQSLISVNLSKLDSLIAIVGEIVITESMVTSSPDIRGLKLDNFTKSARQLRKLTDELQDISMSIRMVPVSGTFQKMKRIVRDMSQKLGKKARLVIEGEDTEVDKSIVDSIGDPIMHIVRNSMDHGIEEHVEDRIALGKDPQGTITLSAAHTGSEVIITVRDDGQGVNPESVLAKARKNGLLTKPESEYTHKEILAFLMAPGFSTNKEVTEYSGRGVGMDVVKSNIENVGGTVSIWSEVGKGMSVTLKIPLTMAIVDGMELSVGKSIFTVPIHNIRQSFKVSQKEVIHDANYGEMINRMGSFYPIIRVHDLYHIDTEITNIEDGILVWVDSGELSYCLFVDELLGEQQVVVKPLPSYLNNFNIKDSGITGCTILGDGNISIILDVTNLHTAAVNGQLLL